MRLTENKAGSGIQAERKAREGPRPRESGRTGRVGCEEYRRVEIGVSDSEKAHQIKGQNTRSGTHAQRRWRDAEGGWFEYRMKVLPETPVTLRCTWWGSDDGRVFDILVDGTKIATQKLARNKPGEFFDVDYVIPVELTKGKESVVVRFAAHPGSIAGGLFGCATLKPEP